MEQECPYRPILTIEDRGFSQPGLEYHTADDRPYRVEERELEPCTYRKVLAPLLTESPPQPHTPFHERRSDSPIHLQCTVLALVHVEISGPAS